PLLRGEEHSSSLPLAEEGRGGRSRRRASPSRPVASTFISNRSGDPPPMTRPASRLAVAGLIAASGFLAWSVAQEPGKESTPARWRQHDIRRPKPPVVEPADGSIASKPPKDAVLLFDGSNLDAWQSSGGGPARWWVADGA